MPPENAEFMIAAYIVAGAIILAYSMYLFLRLRKLK